MNILVYIHKGKLRKECAQVPCSKDSLAQSGCGIVGQIQASLLLPIVLSHAYNDY